MNKNIIRSAQNLLILGIISVLIVALKTGVDYYITYQNYGNPDWWNVCNMIFDLIEKISVMYALNLILGKMYNDCIVKEKYNNELNNLKYKMDSLHNDVINRFNELTENIEQKNN